MEENRKRHVGLNVITGFYLNLGVRNYYGIITGLSSLDSTAHIERAISEIRKALSLKGFFLHVQDLQPGFVRPIQEMLLNGESFPFQTKLIPKDAICFQERDATEGALLCHLRDRTIVTAAELFRRRLERGLRAVGGLEILESSWYTAARRKRGETGYIYQSGLASGIPEYSNEMSSVVVTLVKKWLNSNFTLLIAIFSTIIHLKFLIFPPPCTKSTSLRLRPLFSHSLSGGGLFFINQKIQN